MQKIIKSPKDMQNAGEEFAKNLLGDEMIFLIGDLGAGKTQFARGIISYLCRNNDIKEKIYPNSPSFAILNEYSGCLGKIYHFDFYRLNSINELEDISFEEIYNSKSIIIIEWADKFTNYLPKADHNINIKFISENKRKLLNI